MGMPVTSVIVRSGLNVAVGAESRLPALVQSGFVFGSIAFASSTISMIPQPALSGMLIATGARMLYPSEFNYCYSVDKFTTLPFFTTIAGMLSMGIAEGIGIGWATALGLAVKNNMQLQVKMKVYQISGDFASTGKLAPDAVSRETTTVSAAHHPDRGALLIKPTSTVWQVKGPINFMSMFEIDNMVDDIEGRSNAEDPVVLDMRHVTSLDFTGVEELVDRVIEAADGAPINMVYHRDDLNKVLNKVDKKQRISHFSSIEVTE